MAVMTHSISRGWLGPLYTVTLIAFSVVSLYEFRVHTAMYGLDQRLNVIVDTLQYPERPDIRIRTHYTGIEGLDHALRFFVTVFLPSAAPFTELQQFQLGNFLFAFFPLVVVFSVEATRRGCGAWIRYPSIWALLYQIIGGAIVVPVWFLLFLRQSAQPTSYESTSVQLPLGYAKALMSATVLGYLLPTAALFLPFSDPDLSLKQLLVANWQPCPLYVSIVLVVAAQLFGTASETTTAQQVDLLHVKTMYAYSFIVAAASHIGLLLRSIQAQWILSDIFVPRMLSAEQSVSELIYYIFQLDYIFIFASAVVSAYVAMADLRQLGRSNVNSLVAGISLVVGTLLVGPGAIVAAVWWWREDKLRLDMDGKTKKRL